jgi:Uma2 family endonuclease
MATVESCVPQAANLTALARIPRLCAGDRMTRAEFERRYSAMPAVKKAELVEGVVHMPSPISASHAAPHFDLITFLGIYRVATPGVLGKDSGTIRLDRENEPQPDAFLRIVRECGGQSRIDEDDYVEGAPELIAEISVSSVSYDLHDKLHAYQRNGVREYLVWRVWDSAIDWFVLRADQFERTQPTAAGHYASEVFPGLWLDLAALLRGDVARVSAVLQQGIASPEHAAFVDKLRTAFDGAGSK